jgi:hypothetical protein
LGVSAARSRRTGRGRRSAFIAVALRLHARGAQGRHRRACLRERTDRVDGRRRGPSVRRSPSTCANASRR